MIASDDDLLKGLKFLCRHLVGLCVTYRHATPEEGHLRSRFSTSSGTLLYIEGALYFLTAGHVLRALKELRDHPDVVIEGASLADIFGHRRVSETPIPFNVKDAQLLFVDDDALGLDFGVIPIGPHHARLLAKNGMVALSEENWTRQSNVHFDGYLMLGFPAERVSDRITDASTVKIEATAFAVKRIDSNPDNQRTKYPRFVGQVGAELPLKSLVGMSGGLILGFRVEPQLTYWVVAIQSSWHPQTRTVYGCSLPVLASLMTYWTRENVAVIKELDSNSAELCLSVPGAMPQELHPGNSRIS